MNPRIVGALLGTGFGSCVGDVGIKVGVVLGAGEGIRVGTLVGNPVSVG